MSRCRLKTFLVAIASLAAFHASAESAPQHDHNKAILNSVVEISEKNALNASKVDWPSAKHTATSMLANDSTDVGLTTAVRYVLSKLQDRHSSYRLPSQTSQPSTNAPQSPKPIAAASVSPTGNPLLVVNSWGGRDVRSAAIRVRQELNTALSQKSCGIIVDLSPNSGGNMWPMVMGLLPLLTDGTLGAFEDRDKKKTSIVSTGNGLLMGGSPHFLNALDLPKPMHDPRHVAIVIGQRTASSGEITAVLFKSQGNVKFFGHPTAGVPTANRTFTLENGALLALTTATVQDRSGRIYVEPLAPDVEADDPIGAADSWLKDTCVTQHAP